MKIRPAYIFGILIFIVFLYCLLNSHQLTKTVGAESFLNQTTEPGISIKDWFSDDKTIRDKYLDKLIYSDNIQSYPWMAANPGGATSFNNSLFRKSSLMPKFEEKPLTYYDFSEITYIGNPL